MVLAIIKTSFEFQNVCRLTNDGIKVVLIEKVHSFILKIK